MKIAVSYDNGNVYGHFGDTPEFKIYDVENNEVKSTQIVVADPAGHTTLCDQLHNLNVDELICGGHGDRMVMIMNSLNIKVFGNVEGNADEAVKALLNGTLKYSDEAHHCSCGH